MQTNDVDTTGNEYLEEEAARRERNEARESAEDKVRLRVTRLCRDHPWVMANCIVRLLSEKQVAELADEVATT